MASSSSPKQLWELLQDQQEAVMVDIYVSERSMLLNKRSKFNRRIFRTKKIVKLILYKLICHKRSQQIFGRTSNPTGKLQQIGASKRFLSIGSSVSYTDSSNCCTKGSHCYENQASFLARSTSQSFSIIEHKGGANIEEDNKQLNEGTSSNIAAVDKKEEDDPSTSSTSFSKYPDEDSILASFLRELLVKTLLEKQNQAGIEAREMTGPDFPELLKNKRVLQQSKQLLFDCINEAREIHKPTKSRDENHSGQFLSLQELGKIIYEQMCWWENQNSAQKMNFDVLSVVKSWDDMEQLRRKIGIEIGDSIMDEIIQEIIGLLLQ